MQASNLFIFCLNLDWKRAVYYEAALEIDSRGVHSDTPRGGTSFPLDQ